MPDQSINIEFDSSKYEALKFFIEKQSMTIEQELSAHLDKLYQKNVPSTVRDFVERDVVREQASQEQPTESPASEQAPETESSASSRRRTARRQEQTVPELAVTAPAMERETPAVPEENQGMSMSM